MNNQHTTLVFRVWDLSKGLALANPDWRIGQAVFNALEREEAEIADLVRKEYFNPFYLDEVLPEFWKWLAGWDA